MIYANLAARLTPAIACPFGKGYKEYMPCEALKPFIRCFWTSESLGRWLVNPDLCADIIFDIDDNRAFFCGISDSPAYIVSEKRRFGIRFYAWTAALFSEDTLGGTLNGGFELGAHFHRLEKELAPWIFDAKSTEQRIALSERFLMNNIRQRRSGLFNRAMGEILERRGICSVDNISKELHISSRQLQRVFAEYSGLSPKTMAALVRYQYLWHDILASQNINLSDKASEYGYTDQSHLLKDFKKFHTMTPKRAKEFAFSNISLPQNK